VTTEARERVVEGTLSADQRPRIVNIMGIDIEAQLGEHMLFVANDDQPGFIGALGTLLGEAGINIGSFNLGRAEAGGGAIALIDVDQPISNELLKQVCALSHVRQATALHF
jgi:D-3-phosphoglycerate dehydrogenase